MSKDILTTITEIDNDENLSNSQKDRLLDPQVALINFLNSHLRKVSSKNALKEALEERFTQELQDDTLSTGARLKLFEILQSKETDSELGALNVISKMLEVKASKGNEPEKGATKQESNVNQETLKEAQDGLAFINKLRNTEGLDEFFKKKEK